MSEERVGSRRIYEGRVVSLRIDTVRIGNKTIAREVVEHPGASAIVPLTTDGRVILVNQYRHAAGIELLEILLIFYFPITPALSNSLIDFSSVQY